ncbi:MAG: LptE family protein [Thermodesulfobacteriota bacterium]
MKRTMKINIKHFALLLLIAALLTSCGYHVAGRGGSVNFTGELPGGITSLSIPIFTNVTRKAGVEAVMSTAFVDEFIATVDIKKTNEADARLVGIVKAYDLGPVSYSRTEVVKEYRLTVVLSVRLIRASDGKIIWKDNNVSEYEDFSAVIMDVAATKDAERMALSEIALDLARRVRERILEGS